MRYFLVLAVTSIAGACGLMTTAEAGSCGVSYAPSYGSYSYARYGYPVYHQPYAVAVKPVVKVVEPPLIVQPVVIQEQLAPAFVFQVLSAYQPQPAAYQVSHQPQYQQPAAWSQPQKATARPQTALSEADLDAIAERLSRRLGGNGGDPVPRIGGATGQQASDNGPTDGERRTIDYMVSACVDCHRDPQSKGGVVLFNAAGDFAPRRTNGQLTPAQVYEAMASGSMPPRGPRVSQDVLAGISSWKDAR